MIIDLESGGLGLVFAIMQSVLVSTYIQASLHYLDEETQWFELKKFLQWLFSTIVDIAKKDLKSRDLSELMKIMMEDPDEAKSPSNKDSVLESDEDEVKGGNSSNISIDLKSSHHARVLLS